MSLSDKIARFNSASEESRQAVLRELDEMAKGWSEGEDESLEDAETLKALIEVVKHVLENPVSEQI